MSSVRQAAVAGMFYPGDPDLLRQAVRQYLGSPPPPGDAPKALIVPHAGYVYSGPVAGTGYARLAAGRGRIQRVVLIGPAHRVPFYGLALPGATAFDTPLGLVPVDGEAIERLRCLPQVHVDPVPHAMEHCLEVQLPFLLEVLAEDFAIVPALVGEASPSEVAEALETVWGNAETAVVVSSDLSHYHDYATARMLDLATSRAIEALDPEGVAPDRACGFLPVQGLLVVARRRGLRVENVDLRNSGDTGGSRDHVVGYGTYVLA
ncbi:MAG: AmmeMemoRadiSam system protein B [Candidatus Latescibacterota bacterium]